MNCVVLEYQKLKTVNYFFFNLLCYNNTCRYTGDGARLYTGLTSTKYRTVSFPTMFFVLMSGVKHCAAHIVAPGFSLGLTLFVQRGRAGP